MSEKTVIAIVAIVIALVIIVIISPMGRKAYRNWEADVKIADDATNYETKKIVEDTCRAMLSSYASDRLTYEQYKDSEDKEQQGWAAQAKMRANKTASEYNIYILNNKYVWKDNIPSSLNNSLEIIQ